MDSVCLDQNYSTTQLLSTERPLIDANSNDNFRTQLFLCEGEGRKGEGGLRTKGYFKHGYKKQNGNKWLVCDVNGQSGSPIELTLERDRDELPLITVITVVFNGEKFLEETIKSVISQTYPNVEYIIIDGGSTDGTLEIIRKYEHAIDYWISEKDKGIYDAMNKGINLAAGSWINLMNGGDVLNGVDIFEHITTNDPQIEIYFSDTIFINQNKKVLSKSSVESKSFIHQSMIYRRDLHKQYGLYLNFPKVTISDYLFFSNVLKRENSKKIDHPISIYRIDGISSNPSHYYQKLAVNLMCGHSTVFKVVVQLLYKIALQVFYYPPYKFLKNIFVNHE
ncbi:PGL/p-HBAD biosynthesis glycosyltransferase [mine drainage metagenome]|uniref:PGL/p-HBAD biosynthesis glycosyltransferase n=1 Tax=mine drainage metagenome TaxID=410659 RepID=A0A1J5SLT6_9ZZZZ